MLIYVNLKSEVAKMEFAEKVKYVRATLLISQKQLAKLVSVSFVTINRWKTSINIYQ